MNQFPSRTPERNTDGYHRPFSETRRALANTPAQDCGKARRKAADDVAGKERDERPAVSFLIRVTV